MKIIHFIVNPIAGKGKTDITLQSLSKYFEEKTYHIAVKYSEYKGHARLLTQQSVIDKADIIVACGGDGTINEVASCLVKTKVVLGIIPIGSGNGLARNLKIPKQLKKAITVIKTQNEIAIDVGSINGKYFFSNTGFGFVANAILNFEKAKNRRLISYLKAISQSLWSYKNNIKYRFIIQGKESVFCPFLVFVSNTNEMGYNFSITRSAKLNDGFLDLIIIDKLSRIKMMYLAFLFLVGNESKIKEYSYYKLQDATINLQNNELPIIFQLDGELKRSDAIDWQLEIHKESLRVIGENS